MSMPQVDHDLEDEWVTLYHGDCRDVAETVAPRPADLLLTDPPYGMAFVSGRTAAKATVKSDGVRHDGNRANRSTEVLRFSPHCLSGQMPTLFGTSA